MALRIAHLSDLHFGAIEPRAVEAALAEMRRLAPSYVAVTGDLTQAGRRREFSAAAGFLQALPGEIMAVPGNHDQSVYNPFQRFVRPDRRFRTLIGSEAEWRRERDGLRAVGLNSARPWGLHWNWAHGRLSRRQIAHARDFLMEGPASDVRVLLLHHPILPAGRGPLGRAVGAAGHLREALRRARIDLVLTGHRHLPRVTTVSLGSEGEGTPIWTALSCEAPSALSHRLRGYPNAFHLIEIAGHVASVETFALAAGGFAPHRLHRFVRTAQGWQAEG